MQRDVGQSSDDTGDCHRQRQPSIAEPAAHEIGCGDVMMFVADVPESRENQEQDRIDHDRVRHREKRDGAGAEGERRNGDEGVGGVKVAADQKPGDDRAETPAAQTPFVQQVEIALAPVRGDEAQDRDEGEQQYKNNEGDPFVDPRLLPAIRAGCVGRPTCLILSDEINDGGQDGSDDHPEHLIPVEERYPDPGRIDPVVEGDPQAGDELDRKQQVPPAPAGVGTAPSGVWLIHFAAARPRGAVDRSSTPAHWRQFRLSADWCEFRLGKDTDAVLPSSSRLPRWISGAPAEEV